MLIWRIKTGGFPQYAMIDVGHGVKEPKSISDKDLQRTVKLMYKTINNRGWVK